MPSAPHVPPTAVIYFGRVTLGGSEDLGQLGSGVVNFRYPWQAGVWLRELQEFADEFEVTSNDGFFDRFVYTVVTERSETGEATRARRYEGKIQGATVADAVASAPAEISLPYTETGWLCYAVGRPVPSYRAFSGDLTPAEGVENSPGARVSPPVRRPARERKNRVSGDDATRSATRTRRLGAENADLTTLGGICSEIGVEPKDVRGELRRLKIEKPESGSWTWAKDDPMVGRVREIAQGLKGKTK